MQIGEGLRLLERAAAEPWGTSRVNPAEGAVLADVVTGGHQVPLKPAHIAGFLSLHGPERSDVLSVVEAYALVEAGMLQAACWNPALTDDDVLGLTRKLWDGPSSGPGRVLPGPARKMRAHPRPVAAAMGALGLAWWHHQGDYMDAVRLLAPGGTPAVEIFTTLYNEEEERLDRYGKLLRKDPVPVIEKALLVLGVDTRSGAAEPGSTMTAQPTRR